MDKMNRMIGYQWLNIPKTYLWSKYIKKKKNITQWLKIREIILEQKYLKILVKNSVSGFQNEFIAQ